MLVTLEALCEHLRIDSVELDDSDFLNDIVSIGEAASSVVLKYLSYPDDAFLDSSQVAVGVPYPIQQAVKIYAGIMFKNRDGEMDESLDYGQLPRAVTNIIVQWRKCSIG